MAPRGRRAHPANGKRCSHCRLRQPPPPRSRPRRGGHAVQRRRAEHCRRARARRRARVQRRARARELRVRQSPQSTTVPTGTAHHCVRDHQRCAGCLLREASPRGSLGHATSPCTIAGFKCGQSTTATSTSRRAPLIVHIASPWPRSTGRPTWDDGCRSSKSVRASYSSSLHRTPCALVLHTDMAFHFSSAQAPARCRPLTGTLLREEPTAFSFQGRE